MVPISYTLPKKTLYLYVNLLVLISAFLLLLNGRYKTGRYYETIAVSFSCVIRLLSTVSFSMINNYISELFPSKIRGLSLGIIVTISRLCNCAAPFIEFLAETFDVHPLFVSSLPSFIAIIASRKLPETLNKNLIS